MTIPPGVQIPVNAEPVPQTDAEQIKASQAHIENLLDTILTRLDNHAAGINSIGENLQWMVDNTKGVFQMLASPNIMNTMMSQMMGAQGDGQSGPEAAGPASGPDS